MRPLDPAARTAIVMPICNEHVPTVFGGLAATIDSLVATGESDELRRLRAERHHRSRHPRRRAGRLERPGRARRRGERRRRRRGAARPLPLAPAPHQAQGRQRRRLLPPLGRRLPLHGRPRRRQRHDRRMPDHAGAADGGAPDAGIIQTAPRAVGHETLHAPRPAVLAARLRAAVHRRHALLAARRIALLGPQRHHAHGALHGPLRPGAARRRRAARRARSCRTTSSRRR